MVQLVCPARFWKVLAAQFVQARSLEMVAPADKYVPGTQEPETVKQDVCECDAKFMYVTPREHDEHWRLDEELGAADWY